MFEGLPGTGPLGLRTSARARKPFKQVERNGHIAEVDLFVALKSA
jgi:hypothetical protein